MEFHRPAEFPQNATLATRVACRENFGTQFCHAATNANFRDERDIARKQTVQDLLEIFCSPSEAGRLIELRRSTELEAALQHECELAIERGVFGVPTFIVGDQLFWGNDRLDQALTYASNAFARRISV